MSFFMGKVKLFMSEARDSNKLVILVDFMSEFKVEMNFLKMVLYVCREVKFKEVARVSMKFARVSKK